MSLLARFRTDDPAELAIFCMAWIAFLALLYVFATGDRFPALWFAIGAAVIGMTIVIWCPEPKKETQE